MHVLVSRVHHLQLKQGARTDIPVPECYDAVVCTDIILEILFFLGIMLQLVHKYIV